MGMTMVNILPWEDRCGRGYSDRIRVSNFTEGGNTMFSDMVYDAVLGKTVYFIMQDNGRVAKDEYVLADSTPDQNTEQQEQNSSADNSQDDDGQDDVSQSGTQDVSVNSASYDHVIVSPQDPIRIDCIPQQYRPDVSMVDYVSFDGKCYDVDGKEVSGIYALQFVRPPMTSQAKILAQRALDFDLRLGHSLENIMTPKPIIEGSDPDVETRMSKDRDPNDVISLDFSGVRAGSSTVVTPTMKFLEQWDTEKLKTLQALTAYEFIGETKNPPVDFPELSTLDSETQSLVSNREPFVSRAKGLTSQINAVFESAGIPELVYGSLFPYTPQDIASIGDALGKGATPSVLRKYDLS